MDPTVLVQLIKQCSKVREHISIPILFISEKCRVNLDIITGHVVECIYVGNVDSNKFLELTQGLRFGKYLIVAERLTNPMLKAYQTTCNIPSNLTVDITDCIWYPMLYELDDEDVAISRVGLDPITCSKDQFIAALRQRLLDYYAMVPQPTV